MTPDIAYAGPRTDPRPRLPASGYRDHKHPNPSIVLAVEEIFAFGDPTVFLVEVDGILHRMHEFEPIRTWIPESQAATAESQWSSLATETEEDSTELVELPRERADVGLAQVKKAVTELVNLPEGWDGYNGLPVRPEVAEHALRLMAAIKECTQIVPDVVPLSNGGLQMEWFVGAYEVEVAIAPDGSTHFYFECTNDGRVREFPLGDSLDTEKIAPFFQELCR